MLAPALNMPEVVVGRNLVAGTGVSLGQAAPAGLAVKITSSDPTKLLFSRTEQEKGSASITVPVPAGQAHVVFVAHGLGDSGKVEYTAEAPGYGSRSGNVILAPSGVIITGPASITRSGLALGFVTSLAERKKTTMIAYTAYLDPVTHRAADLTVQHLRPGVSISVVLKSSHPSVGTVGSPITIHPNTDSVETLFTPLKPGKTTISVDAPDGYTLPSNANSVMALVKE